MKKIAVDDLKILLAGEGARTLEGAFSILARERLSIDTSDITQEPVSILDTRLDYAIVKNNSDLEMLHPYGTSIGYLVLKEKRD